MAEAKTIELARAPAPSPATHTDWRRWLLPIKARLYRHAMANIFELDDLEAASQAQGPGILPDGCEFRLAEREDLAACAALAGATRGEYLRRWQEGDQCYVAFVGSQPVNLNWLHFGPCYVFGLGLLVDARPSECYLYNVFTDPAHRGQGLYRNTQQRLIRILAGRGITRIRQVVAIDNTVPLLALPKFGYTLAEVVRHRCILGLKITTTCDLAGRIRSRRASWRLPAGVFRI